MLESIETILVAIRDQVCAAFVQLIEVRPSFLEVSFLFWFVGVFQVNLMFLYGQDFSHCGGLFVLFILSLYPVVYLFEQVEFI